MKRSKAKTPPATRNTGTILWISLGLIFLAAAVYYPVSHSDFAILDDPSYVSQNRHIADGLTLHGISWALTAGYAANWHPLTWMSHMLDIDVYGMNAGGHHLTNLIFHIANSVILFLLLYRMTGALPSSAFVAGIFAVHPLHVESVAWVAERKDVLSTFLWMLTVWSYVRYVQRPELRRYALVMLLFALALMSKPMVVTLPFILLLLDYWPLRRPMSGRLLQEKLPLFAMSLVSSIVTFVVQREGGAVVETVQLALAPRLANAVVAYVAYITKMFWPTRLAPFYPYQVQPFWMVAGAIACLTSVTLLVLLKAKELPYLLTGWLLYLGSLVPVIGLVQVGAQSMADRYTYVPMIGISIIVAWGIPDLVERWRRPQPMSAALNIAGIVLILACAVIARAQVDTWKDKQTPWLHAVQVTTGNYVAETFLGVFAYEQGHVDEAIRHYEEALRVKPDYPDVNNDIGPALASKGRIDEAITHVTKALRLRPAFLDAHNNLGVLFAIRGQFDKAIPEFSEAVKLDPDSPPAHFSLGTIAQRQGRTADAIKEFQETLRIDPRHQEARRALDSLKNASH